MQSRDQKLGSILQNYSCPELLNRELAELLARLFSSDIPMEHLSKRILTTLSYTVPGRYRLFVLTVCVSVPLLILMLISLSNLKCPIRQPSFDSQQRKKIFIHQHWNAITEQNISLSWEHKVEQVGAHYSCLYARCGLLRAAKTA